MPRHHPLQGPASRHRSIVLAASAASLLASVGFVLAPVEQPEAVYSWPASSGDATGVAIPLMLGRPAELSASGSCADVRAEEPGTVLLSTTPLTQMPGSGDLPGLRVETGDDDTLRVRTGGTVLPGQELPAGDCAWEVVSTPSATTLTVDGEIVAEEAADVRPTVAGVFTDRDEPGDLAVDVTADTVFQTSPSPLKVLLGALAVLSLLTALVLLARGERRVGDRDEGTADAGAPARRGPLRLLVDAAVVAGLAVWTVIGPLTIDDGYITGIIRSREANGYIGNVHRWFNAPEAPFGWFYEVMDAWSAVSSSTTWMRVPSALLGVATWLLVSRGLLPRLRPGAAGPGWYLLTALLFGVWWLPTNIGLRPEPWVAAGLAAVLVLEERALRRQQLLPLALGLVVAGAALAVTPTGAVAFLPFLAALVPILKLVRSVPGAFLPAALLGAAAAGSALLLMFSDQSLAAVLRANEIRAVLPGAVDWHSELERWSVLLTAGDVQGPVARRVPVLLTMAALGGIAWHLAARRWPDDRTRALAGRLATTFALSLVVLLFTPTKWTLHFGALAPLGTALLVLACGLFSRADGDDGVPPGRAALRGIPAGELTRTAVALTAVLMAAAWSYAGWNQWPYLSNAAVPWRDLAPQLAGIDFSAVFLTGAALTTVLATVLVVRARVLDEPTVALRDRRVLVTPVAAVAALATLTVAVEFGSFLKSNYSLRDTYSPTADALATLSGRPCGLAEELTAEPDPAAGLLEPTTATTGGDAEPVLDGFVAVRDGEVPEGRPPLTMAGTGLPGWAAVTHAGADGAGPARLTTGWFRLPDGFAESRRPLVVTTSGDRGAGTSLRAEFGALSGDRVEPLRTAPVRGPEVDEGIRDARVDPVEVPDDADVVRLVVRDRGAATALPLAVSVPRVPVTVPFADVVPADTPAIVDWTVGFVWPCQRQAVQSNGVTDVPEWRIGSFDDAGDIVFDPAVGGPFAPARQLVDQVPVPVYQENRPMDRPVQLYRWEPRVEVTEPRTSVEEQTVAAWAR